VRSNSHDQAASITHPITIADDNVTHDDLAFPNDACEMADGEGGGMPAEVDTLVETALVTDGTLDHNHGSASSTIHSDRDVPESCGTRQGENALRSRGL
jgi:hypothetical protein